MRRQTRSQAGPSVAANNGMKSSGKSDSPTVGSTASFKDGLQQFQFSNGEDEASPSKNRAPISRDIRTTKANPSSSDNGNSDRLSRKRPQNLSSPTTASPAKKRKSSGYAPPSTYAHLPVLTDILEEGLICAFIGTNPGVRTATAGHAYAHPSNLFWRLLHSSGCTDRRCRPEEDVDMPRLYRMGNTNIVARPTKDASELSKQEMVEGAEILEKKMRRFKPEAVCIVGKGIWEAVWRRNYGKGIRKEEFRYGWQEERMGASKVGEDEVGQDGEKWIGARIFVASSTSGLAANTKPAEKEAIWKPFGEWVQMRRAERGSEGQYAQKDGGG